MTHETLPRALRPSCAVRLAMRDHVHSLSRRKCRAEGAHQRHTKLPTSAHADHLREYHEAHRERGGLLAFRQVDHEEKGALQHVCDGK